MIYFVVNNGCNDVFCLYEVYGYCVFLMHGSMLHIFEGSMSLKEADVKGGP